MKTAIIHYWLIGMRGGVKVVETLCDIFPDADIYTHVFKKNEISSEITTHSIVETFINKLPFSKKLYKHYLPFMPLALENIDLNDYDLVISSESGPAKGVITKPSTCHICYCHSPMRYLWNMYNEYRNKLNWFSKIIWSLISKELRVWDYVSAQRVDYFIANSENVKKRIKKYWNRDSHVINPPVDFYKFKNKKSEDYYLFVGQLNPYKKADLAVQVFNKNGLYPALFVCLRHIIVFQKK